jgi:hypothetical protein
MGRRRQLATCCGSRFSRTQQPRQACALLDLPPDVVHAHRAPCDSRHDAYAGVVHRLCCLVLCGTALLFTDACVLRCMARLSDDAIQQLREPSSSAV